MEEKKSIEEQRQEIVEKYNYDIDNLDDLNASKIILSLGFPNKILLSTGIVNKPMRLYANKLLSKAKKHGFTLKDVKDLPRYVSAPIAIFKGSIEESYAILTDIELKEGNLLVSLNVGRENDVGCNIISSVYEKKLKGVLFWILNGKLLYTNKSKTLDYLRISAPIAEAQDNQELLTATNIVEGFENPSVLGIN